MWPARHAARRLHGLFPVVGPWTRVALWHGRQEFRPPTTDLGNELDRICSQRLAALTLRYARDHNVPLDPAHRKVLQESTLFWTTTALSAVEAAGEVLADLHAWGVPRAVAGGPGIARHYASPQCRPYAALDLLVPPALFAPVVERLESHGWTAAGGTDRAAGGQPPPSVRRWCQEGIDLHDAGGRGLRIHQRVPPWLWGRGLHPADAIARGVTVEAAGTPVDCLDAADNLLVSALRLVGDPALPGRTLLIWRDIVELVVAVDVELAASRAHETGLAGWLANVLDALPQPMGTQRLREALGRRAAVPHALRLELLLSPRAARLGIAASPLVGLPLPNGLVCLAGRGLNRTGPTQATAGAPPDRDRAGSGSGRASGSRAHAHRDSSVWNATAVRIMRPVQSLAKSPRKL